MKPRIAAATSAAQVSPCTRTGHSSTRAGNALAKPVENVADDGAGRRGHDADDARQVRKLPLPRRVEQALGGELLRRSSSSAISAPTPAGSSASMTIW